MGPLNNEEVINPKTKNIRLYVKRVFISDDFDGELVRLLYELGSGFPFVIFFNEIVRAVFFPLFLLIYVTLPIYVM